MEYFALQTDPSRLTNLSNSALAYLGDAVFELMVRAKLCTEGSLTAGKLNREAKQYVTAGAQAAMAERLVPLLSETELAVYRRVRNSKLGTIPKGATRSTYQSATALEGVFGYLYLQGDTDRLSALMDAISDEKEGLEDATGRTLYDSPTP